MTNARNSKLTLLAGLVGATALLAACTDTKELAITNGCGQPVQVGHHQPGGDTWLTLADSERSVINIEGRDESVALTVLDAEAEQIVDPVELPMDDFDFEATDETPESDRAELELTGSTLCP